jgi:glucan phosphorylase
MVEQHLSSSWGSMNGHGDRFLELGTYDSGSGPQFNMTALAMRSSGAINAVSQLHGIVTRDMFAPLVAGVADRRPPGRGDHERRTRPDVDGSRVGHCCSSAI